MASTSEVEAQFKALFDDADAGAARPVPPNAWRLELLATLGDREVEEREYILRTHILISELNEALSWMMDETPAHQAVRDKLLPDFKQVVDRVWREAHHADRARDSAMSLCRALDMSHDAAHAIALLHVSGYVRLADLLDRAQLERAWRAWHDRSRGMKKGGGVGKYQWVARLVRKLGLKISAVTIKSLWANNRGYPRRRPGTVRRAHAASSPPLRFRVGTDGIPRPE